MKNVYGHRFLPSTGRDSLLMRSLSALALVCMLLAGARLNAQTETFSTGSYIVNMGITPQTVGNGLKPYGLVYDLLKNYQVPVKWVINQSKVKDGPDFTHNGITYRGGPFIIPAEYRTAAVNARITFWQGQGVQGATTVAPITVPVYATLFFAPKWTLDKQNGAIAVDFFTNAGIPATAYGGSSSNNWKLPSQLNACDDLFVMPHADPTWSTHSNLFNWNLSSRGSIWLGCHSGSALEDMFNPANPSQQTNFLAEKTGNASGGGPYFENALVLWGNHSDGTLPYTYDYPTDPMMQFMGIMDAATQNGSEQIYITKAPGWRSTTKVGVYDPNHPQQPSTAIQHRAGILAWGRGFGANNRGWVMMQSSHDIAKKSDPANIAAQRAFFNFSFIALADKAVVPTITGIVTPVTPGSPINLSFTVPAPASINDYTAQWYSSCGGTFSPSSTSKTVTFTPPATSGSLNCNIQLVITDICGRQTFANVPIVVQCNLTVSTTLGQPCFGGGTNGSIGMTITGGTAPYTYSWTRTGGGSGTGTGTTISGLSAGTYNVTVTSANGCAGTFSRTLTEAPQITITATPTPVSCNGGATGSISVSVSGGTPGYTYNWDGGVTTQNRSGLAGGTYNLTVTDSRGCTATTSVVVAGATAITLTPTATPASCFGTATGAISLAVSGGSGSYTYLWNDGTTTQNRTGIAAGTYAVTVTDANACTQTATGITVTQPAAALAITFAPTNVACNGASTGSITANVTGGTMPYTYDWTGTPAGDGTATISSLAAGTYAVTVTDNKGCTAVGSVTITQPFPLRINSLVTDPTCPPTAAAPVNSDGAINLTVSGGNAPYTYSWTTVGGSGLVPTAEDQTGLTAGTYNVTVTDTGGCTITASFVLNNTNPFPVQPGTINNN